MKARTQGAFVALWLGAAASAEAQPYPPQQYPAPQYPQQRPPQYPPQQYPAPQYPQQRPPQYPPQQYPPQPYPPQQYPAPQRPPQYPPQQYPPQQRPPQPSYPPQQYPAPQYPPQQRPPQPYPPQQYPAPQYPPQQRPPQPYPQPAPQYPPGGPYPAPQQQPGYPPGYVPPYVPPVPTQAPDPLLDSQQRYHQQLGAYRRTFVLPPPDPKKGRTAYVRLANLSKRHHDGLYFRFAGGFGALHDSAKSNRPLPSKADFGYEPAPFDGSGGGTGGATELSVGYTLAAGFSLGVGVFTAIAPSPTLDVNDPNTGSYLLKTTQIAVIGVLGDWYFFPSKGFHAQVSPGLGTLVSGAGQTENVDAEGNSTGPQAQAHTSVGLGLMFGVGYDFWVSDEWSLGFLGRFLYTSTSGDDDRGVSWTHHSYCPSLMVSATYN